jgi:hypothetical protein
MINYMHYKIRYKTNKYKQILIVKINNQMI